MSVMVQFGPCLAPDEHHLHELALRYPFVFHSCLGLQIGRDAAVDMT